ncbi:hypothetical protein FHS27_001379 [Rhodopirellula rubra]|uniref:Uncharacterized protein n=1 Tax=Aporhodopirellula rubra TaxID=980271 RepID=A0A7W5DWQ8_9BACT|nr:hypothetical protein [Aporhodopirellula rubra]MBB3205579.1 hypothetical protein [Aporhodopirellula rubra]
MNAYVEQLSGTEPVETEMVGRLARLLLDPSLDRCDIADGILSDIDLIRFLCGYEQIVIENTAAPGTNWMLEQRGSHELSFLAHALNEPRAHFVMPLLLGSLCDHSGRPWFQSSVYEFVPAVEGIKTTNIGGKPMFKANLHPAHRRSQPAAQTNPAFN